MITDDTYEPTDRELAFRSLDKSRLSFVGEFRCYRVFKHAGTGEYWTTCLGDYVSHHTENPLPRD